MKVWTKAQVDANARPSLEECERQIEAIMQAVVGRQHNFSQKAIEFYAAEAFAMMEKLRIELA